MKTDNELLRRYAESHDEAAFTEVVHRHLPMVYFSALRQTGGDGGLAEDVAQKVFANLAQQAAALAGHATIVGWLHTCTRYIAHKAIREQRRRQAREQEAVAMHEQNTAPEPDLEPLYPILDEAIGQLRETDRNVLLLRFFQGKSHREVATILGLSENTANKRLERALEKVRQHFFRRGVTTTAALLASALAATAARPVPVGLPAKVADASLAGTNGITFTLSKFLFMSTKTKIITMAVVVAILAAIPLTMPYWQRPATSATTGASSPSTVAVVSAPHLPPAKVTPSASAPVVPAHSDAMEKPASIHWTLNTYIASQDWQDLGADTPENALQTLYWARKTGNLERANQLLMKETVFISPEAESKNRTGVPATVSNEPLDFRKLLGGKVVRSKVVSETVVEMNVNEDWTDSETIQEWFQFHKINGQWQYTQSVTVAQ